MTFMARMKAMELASFAISEVTRLRYVIDSLANAEGPILILQDTTTFSYQRDKPERIGFIGKSGNLTKPLTQCGILMHSSLAVTTAGVPLGLAAIRFRTRSKFKSCNALKAYRSWSSVAPCVSRAGKIHGVAALSQTTMA